jgi:hypothetical protein
MKGSKEIMKNLKIALTVAAFSLLTACSTDTSMIKSDYSNFDKYISNLEVEYLIIDDKCVDVYLNYNTPNTRTSNSILCVAEYTIVPTKFIQDGRGFTRVETFYLAHVREGNFYVYMKKGDVINEDGVLEDKQDYFDRKLG